MTLIGRLDEQRAIDRVLDAARVGLSGALVLQGDPGTGKSSLLDYAVGRATADFEIVAVSGTESEVDWGFSSLRRLLQPWLPQVGRMNGPHADSLRAAFGLGTGPTPDRFKAGLGTLTLLAEVAIARPVLCIIDDAQWLDTDSLDALALVGRRIQADRIAIMFATRSAEVGLSGIPTLNVDGLTASAAWELLRQVVDGPVDDEIAQRVALETRGVPLAIIELADSLSAHRLATSASSPEPLPIGGQLTTHFLRTIRVLPQTTQMLLLVKAADSSGDPSVVAAASATLGAPIDAAIPAQAADIIGSAPDLTFRHPLIRSAVYSSATPQERRRVHRALADAINPIDDPDRHAWHLAAAAIGQDDDIAQLLEDAARRTAARGANASAGRFLQRAFELTVADAARGPRLLGAAEAYLAGGAPGRARAVLEHETAVLDDPFQRAIAKRLLAATGYALGEALDTPGKLMDAVRAIAPFDIHLARVTVLQTLAAARVPGRFSVAGETYRDAAGLAAQIPLPADSQPTAVDLLIDGNIALFFDGHEAAIPQLREAFSKLSAGVDAIDSADALLWLSVGCWGAAAIGDDEVLHHLANQLSRTARDRTALEALSQGLIWQGVSEFIDGSFATARTHFAERTQMMTAIGRGSVDVGELLMLAWAGKADEARAEAELVERYAVERSHGWMLPFVEYSMTALELGLGNYQAAFESATKDYQDNPFLSMLSFPDLIEAAARSGQTDAARAALSEFEQRALPSGTPLSLGLLARCHALLASTTEVEALYTESIALLGRCRGRLQLARTQLLYGEWLRRQKRRTDAREQLRIAYGLFGTIGAEAFAERARVELAATGAHARRRTVDTLNELTPQEAQVAHLAGTGATNGEVAAQLFISKSTVDYHLGKVYRKLEITSRRELREALTKPATVNG